MGALNVAALLRQVPPLRGCDLCRHGQDGPDGRQCTAQLVTQPASTMPCALARRRGGPCGPDAEHLDFPGLHAPARRGPHW